MSQDDHIQGSSNASITLVEYGDYECPYCGMAYHVIKDVQDHFGEQLRFVFRNFPLTQIHTHALAAAEAAEYASKCKHFWEMHDLIYENQSMLGTPLFLKLAQTLKLSEKEMMAAIQDNLYEPKIKADFLGGVRSGVNGTPTFFINSERYNGTFDYDNLVMTIESVFAK